MSEDEVTFTNLFVQYMVGIVGETFIDGESVSDYALRAAKTYWGDEETRMDGPEECARADMDCWDE